MEHQELSWREHLLHITMVTRQNWPAGLAPTWQEIRAHMLLLLELYRILRYLQWLNVAVPPVIVGAALSTVAKDSSNTIGWEPNSRQLGVNLSVSKTKASINNPKQANWITCVLTYDESWNKQRR